MGFILAGMIIMGDWGSKDPIKAYAMPILIMGIFIFDVTYTTISRIITKKVVNFREWLEFTGKDHLHHRLTFLGLSAKQTVFFIYFLTASLGMSALVLRNGNVFDAVLLLIQAVFIYLIVVILMLRGILTNRRKEDKLKKQEENRTHFI
jgi:UDP-GlcNAc:undecaprenyl-phosphate GlcNAc-1-phosphate transferase